GNWLSGHSSCVRIAGFGAVLRTGRGAGQYVPLPSGQSAEGSGAHRTRLALAEAAGTVLAGGLSLLGIEAPEHL
ncbi:DALR anticodon-binding domain-containing protein, partial [Streptomyces acidiscabies]|uniref:DALR anticodon-binding domain-containing protein n=1 Tax=Streptomyces acidiscabies TaxID=42234 RepID=UPI00227795E2